MIHDTVDIKTLVFTVCAALNQEPLFAIIESVCYPTSSGRMSGQCEKEHILMRNTKCDYFVPAPDSTPESWGTIRGSSECTAAEHHYS